MSRIVSTIQPLYSLEPGYRFVKNMCQPKLLLTKYAILSMQ